MPGGRESCGRNALYRLMAGAGTGREGGCLEVAVGFRREVGVAVENEGRRVRVRPLVFPDQPVAYCAPRKEGGVKGAHLVQPVTCGAEDR